MAISMWEVGDDGGVYVVDLSAVDAPRTSSHGLLWVDLQARDAPDLAALAEGLGLQEAELDFLAGNRSRLSIPSTSYESVAAVLHRVCLTAAQQFNLAELRVLSAKSLIITVQTATEGLPPLNVLDAVPARPAALTAADAVSGIISAVLREYPAVLDHLEDAVEEMEGLLFQEARLDAELSHKIYQLLQEAHRCEWALRPLEALSSEGGSNAADAAAESTAEDAPSPIWSDLIRRARRMRDRVELLRSHLENAVTLHSTLLTIEQNEATRRLADASYAQGEQSKKISGWAAILFAPTLIASIYGMNFRHMPELHWSAGYPLALALMLGLSLGLWLVFKRRNWL
ncbi:CorA family divalent cation transporter [Nesterenkonia sp. Act20]|uniref:CorA family divalent cation transporter n=1 Tax=Nesterenkonia sp. Act20 TaxID=1483432 RepID=UPI001C48472A|nr:CorA family divalent cation transporter [Nesterenkonia sp. Act20]